MIISQLTELQSQLKNIFQINRADLDFGIYLILNSKSQEITHYIEQTLPKTIQAAFTENSQNQLSQLQHELEQAIKQASDLGVNPDDTTKVKDLKAQIAQIISSRNHNESEIYNHLTTFFSRYYEEGNFINQRRYKGDTYAIFLMQAKKLCCIGRIKTSITPNQVKISATLQPQISIKHILSLI